MKKYIAQKAMRFDKSYQKGEEIPESVIDKDMINKLLRCGVLAVTEVAEISQISEEEQQEETSEITEEQQQEETSKIPQEQQKTPLQTKEQLLQYKKEELEQMAEQKGIEVKQSMTKADIVELLLQEE